MAVPVKYRRSGEPVIITFDWQDVASGTGYVVYDSVVIEGEDFKSYNLTTADLPSYTYDGKIEAIEDVSYFIESPAFTQVSKLQGIAFVSGFFDYVSSTSSITAEISLVSGEISADGIGSNDWSDAPEVTQNGDTWSLKKTIQIDDYVHEVTNKIHTSGGGGTAQCRMEFIYDGENQTQSSTQIHNTDVYTAKTYENVNPERYVSKVEVWLRNANGGFVGFEQDTKVWKENTSGLTSTVVGTAVTTADITADTNYLIEIPLTARSIKIGERIVLRLLTNDGDDASFYIVDPTSSFETTESLKLHVPFEIQQ